MTRTIPAIGRRTVPMPATVSINVDSETMGTTGASFKGLYWPDGSTGIAGTYVYNSAAKSWAK